MDITDEQIRMVKAHAIAEGNKGNMSLADCCDIAVEGPCSAEMHAMARRVIGDAYARIAKNVTVKCRLSEGRSWVYAEALDGFGGLVTCATLDYVLGAAKERGWTIVNAQDVLLWLHANACMVNPDHVPGSLKNREAHHPFEDKR